MALLLGDYVMITNEAPFVDALAARGLDQVYEVISLVDNEDVVENVYPYAFQAWAILAPIQTVFNADSGNTQNGYQKIGQVGSPTNPLFQVIMPNGDLDPNNWTVALTKWEAGGG